MYGTMAGRWRSRNNITPYGCGLLRNIRKGWKDLQTYFLYGNMMREVFLICSVSSIKENRDDNSTNSWVSRGGY